MSNKTRILETLNESVAPGPQTTRILGEAGMQPPPEVREPIGATPPGLDNAPPRSRWPGRLLRLVLVTVLGVALWEWGQWSWAAWQWHPVAGAMLGGLGAVLAGTGLKAWADVRRQRARLTEVEQLRLEMQAALADPRERLALDWLDRLQALYEDTPLAAQMNAACADLDQSYSADEISRRLSRQFYQPLDVQARQMLQRDAVATGLLVATSPWVAVDILLVLWRNLRMMRRIALCYGLPVSQVSSWRLARHVLRNIALAGGTEVAIGALTDSLLSGVLEKLAARVGQGVGVGLYSARLGHFTLDLCRAVPLQDQQGLVEDNRGIVRSIRERLGRVTDDKA